MRSMSNNFNFFPSFYYKKPFGMIWCKSESFLSFSAMNSSLSARDIVFLISHYILMRKGGKSKIKKCSERGGAGKTIK